MAEVDDLREEVAFWRRSVVATIWASGCEMKAARERGDLDAANYVKVNRIWPLRASLRDADAKAWHATCVGCGGSLRNGQIVLCYDEGERCHFSCEDVDFQPESHELGEDRDAIEVYDDGFGEDAMERMLQFVAAEERTLDECFDFPSPDDAA
jgi:hypothetical protein